MNPKLSAVPAGLALAFFTCNAMAAGPGDFLDEFKHAMAHGKSSHMVDIDNDSLLLKRDDGFYTGGMRYTLQYSVGDNTQSSVYGWRIGQDMYTASDIKLAPALVGPPDHPYAGWLYTGVFKANDKVDGSSLRYGVDIGCLGPCAGGEWTQTTLHRIINQPLPQAWSKQVRNEAGVILYGDYAPLRWKLGSAFDLTPTLHGRFGNIHTDAGAGIKLRAGQLNILPQQSTLHAYLNLDARAVAWNASLQGGYFSSGNPHTVKPKRLVGEVEIGLAWNSASFGISAALVRRSNEINDLSNAVGAQNFARLQFSYTP
jgi:lipid A 3-O-deacylase